MSIEFPVPVSNVQAVNSGAALRSPQLSGAEPSAFAEVLQAVGSEIDRGEQLVRGVVRGRAGQLSAADLIALQAGIYRYTEFVDLSAKFIDRATTAVRTTLQSGT